MRRVRLTVAFVLLVPLAGRGGMLGGHHTTTLSPERYPPGVNATGVTNPDAFVHAYRHGLYTHSFSMNHTTDARLPNRTTYGRAVVSGPVASMAHYRLTGRVSDTAAGNRRMEWYAANDTLYYRFATGTNDVTTGNQTGFHAPQLFFNDTVVDTHFVYPVVRRATSSGVTYLRTTNGHASFRVNVTPATIVPVLDVRETLNVHATFVVRDDGFVRSFVVRYVGKYRRDGWRVTVSQSYRYTPTESVTVSEPPWVAPANRTAG